MTLAPEKLGALPSVSFAPKSNKPSDDAKLFLQQEAAKCVTILVVKVVVVGYCASDKKEQQLSWDHVNAVINYLVDKEGVSADRFIFNHGQTGGDCNTVDLRGAADGEDGPNMVEPPPEPSERRTSITKDPDSNPPASAGGLFYPRKLDE